MTTTLDLDDIQGNILRGFRADYARHIAVALPSTDAARTVLTALTSGKGDSCPQVSTAARWDDKPDYCINVALTAPGLTACGVPAAILAAFPAAFTQGSASRSSAPPAPNNPFDVGLGDIGDSAPPNWILGGPETGTVHLLASLYCTTLEALDGRSAQLDHLWTNSGAKEISRHDAVALPDGMVHFGYRDGIAQPWIEGTTGPRPPDLQPDVPTGDFLLGMGYRNHYQGNYIGSVPPTLGNNGTYSAFRILRQDTTAFDQLIATTATNWLLHPEEVAGKLLGRWSSGTPMMVSPETQPEPAPAELNEFDYAPTADHPVYLDDAMGLRCPIGAHIRRLNPRGALVMGQPHSRRIIRRGMPYGPPVDPHQPDDIERGLVGHFICGDLESQYEFIMSTWVNKDIATAGLRGTRDPILGAQPASGGRFVIRSADSRDPIVLTNVPRLVQTRGSLYCFLPGLGALRNLATGLKGVAA